MSPRGRWIIGLTVAAGGALGAVMAIAQEPAPTGNYGGGAIPAAGKSVYGRGSMVISLRTTGTNKVQILAGMGARCATAPIRANVVLAADGSFSRSGTAKVRSGRRVVRTPYTISGTINGLTATGTASAKSTDREPGYVTETCKTGTVAWGARRSFGDIGVPGAAPPGVHLYGVTKQAVGKRRHAIALRISPDGTRVKRALYSLNLKCGSGTDQIVDSPKQNLTIRADGKVSNTESYSRVVDRHRRVHLKESFSAKVGSTGATGSFKVAGRVSSRRTGRTLLLCSSGKVKWTAGV